ncbi:MAG: hypothetical protein IJX17_02945 [Clostridia bacterium]|nr:hypothetical protein [Clostridia bacterium]
MIAFNELLSNINTFKESYNKIGFKINLDTFVNLENTRKDVQLKYEKLKSECNKKCHNFAILKKTNQELSSLYNEILQDEKTIKEYEIQLEKYNKLINNKLSKLPNLPDEILENDIFISKSNKELDINNFKLESILNGFTVKPFNYNTANYLITIENQLFNESNINQIINCLNGYIILTTDYNLNNTIKTLLDYLKENSLSISQIKSKSMLKHSTSEYSIKLNNKNTLNFEIIKEYYTREYNIKYKNSSIDMTKFVNQINLTIL